MSKYNKSIELSEVSLKDLLKTPSSDRRKNIKYYQVRSNGEVVSEIALSNTKNSYIQKMATTELFYYYELLSSPESKTITLEALTYSDYWSIIYSKDLLNINHPSYSEVKLEETSYLLWNNPKVKFYTYKITADNDNHYYIGRKTVRTQLIDQQHCLTDGYFGSGGKKFQEWIAGKNIEELHKTILGMYASWSEVRQAEKELIGDLYKTDPNCLNMQSGGLGSYPSGVITIKLCDDHGEVKHLNGNCYLCMAQKSVSMKECSVHGIAKHKGSSCYLCVVDTSVSQKLCSTHGETLHRGDSCVRCLLDHSFTIENCENHGLVKHQRGYCCSCRSESSFSKETCLIHGEEVTFLNGKCIACKNASSVSVRVCAIHGESKFQGDSCSKCFNSASIKMKKCCSHGKTKHRGETCMKCSAQKITVMYCDTHGESKHTTSGECFSCRNLSRILFKECKTHGTVKHRGSSCCSCIADKTAAKRKTKKNDIP